MGFSEDSDKYSHLQGKVFVISDERSFSLMFRPMVLSPRLGINSDPLSIVDMFKRIVNKQHEILEKWDT